MSNRLLVVFGKRTAEEICATAQLAYGTFFDQYRVVYFVDDENGVARLRDAVDGFTERYFIIGAVDYSLRRAIADAALGIGMVPFTVIHPSAVVDPTANIGRGCFIGALCVVSISAVVQDFVILHLHCSVGHDSTIGTHTTVLPGARISGDVVVGSGALIGSNAFVFQGSRIGDQSQIDALTYVKGDIPEKSIVSARYGIPLKRIL